MTAQPTLYQAKLPTFEMVQWDGSDQGKSDLVDWTGGLFGADDLAAGADPSTRAGHLWDPVGRVVVAVAVGDWVAADAAGSFFVVTAADLAAGYVPAPAA